jgi:hypothetical protein
MFRSLNKAATCTVKAGSLKMNTALEYSTRVVQEGGRRCKKSSLNDLVHLTPLRIPLKVPKCEIFDRSDFHDFYPIKSLWEGDFGVKIKRFKTNI